MVTHSVTMLEKHLVYAGETPPRNFTTNRVKKRSMKPEDPMSHRIIEKRRRDRMNNCLADLSRLIPPEYLKKGRGRIEKTEIIEMAIKHMRHLQNLIATSRFNENSDNSVPSPPAATSSISREPTTIANDTPIVIEHYRLGYLECLSEAMHFLVEVQGYFAGDSLCVQMINHLHKHCDKILKGNTLNFPKKHVTETASSDSSASPANLTYNNSPPLGMSNSTGSASDDNQPNQNFETGRHFENSSRIPEYRSARRCSESSYSKKSSEGCYSKYGEPESVEGENRSDSEHHQSYVLKCRNKDDSKSYLNNFETAVSFGPRNYSMAGSYPNVESAGSAGSAESVSLREENGNGPSQLREMLTSPTSQVNGHSKATTEVKDSASPISNTSCYEFIPGNPQGKLKPLKDAGEGEYTDATSDNHHIMYKFKNNIKQRFSKEKRENPEFETNGEIPLKKTKPNEEFLKFSDPLMRERLNLLDREIEEEKIFKFNADFETKKRIRYTSESDAHDGDISNRLSFGHKTSEKGRRWEEAAAFSYHGNPKLWSLSPNGALPYLNSQPPLGCKVSGRHVGEYSPATNNSFGGVSVTGAEPGQGVPIFALHAKGSYYIPLTLDHATLAPFLTILGVTKTDEATDEKTVLHPVTISVNFQSHLVR